MKCGADFLIDFTDLFVKVAPAIAIYLRKKSMDTKKRVLQTENPLSRAEKTELLNVPLLLQKQYHRSHKKEHQRSERTGVASTAA